MWLQSYGLFPFPPSFSAIIFTGGYIVNFSCIPLSMGLAGMKAQDW